MEKKYFPIFIDLSEKKIVVIGGGVIATRRVNTLLSFVEKIVVVAPKITPELQEAERLGQILWICAKYSFEYITEADMVIAATDQPEINCRIKRDCEAAGKMNGRQILVSVIDDKELCDFYFPSIVQSEEVIVGINSGGTSPAKTKSVRRQIEDVLASDSIYKSEVN